MSRPVAADVVASLDAVADPERAIGAARYFKTGPGEYGEGDVFIGVSLPDQRRIVRRFRDLPMTQTRKLLLSEVHEHRMTALLILVDQFRRADDVTRRAIFDVYLANTARINNWDLVDASAEHIVGPWTYADGIGPLLPLVRSADLWERRIAMIGCRVLPSTQVSVGCMASTVACGCGRATG